PPPPPDGAGGLRAFDAARARGLPRASAAGLRQDALVRAAAEGARIATEATRIALGARPAPAPPGAPDDSPFAYAVWPARLRWWRRLRAHLSPESVLLQNALRIACALAVARLLVGVLNLSHGFWVLLATLSTMRTSAADTRSALRPAFLGTAAGAGIAAVLLVVVGDVPVFYEAALPLVVLVGFGVGPVLGPAWMQAAMTLVFVLVFTQLSDPDWHLSGVRLLDVVVGGAVGALAGLLAWPKGGRGQLRRATADLLTESAALCRAVTALLCTGGDGTVSLRPARRAVLLTEATYAQYRTEDHPHRTPDPAWGRAKAAAYQALSGGEIILGRHRSGSRAPLPPEAAARLTALADRAAAEYLRSAAALRTEEGRPATALAPRPADTGTPRTPMPPAHALLVADTEAWLTGAVEDAARVRRDRPGEAGSPAGRDGGGGAASAVRRGGA
ncbi:FUSC family protein, partial [Streptomyces sp. I05A-00742]|uniref:FUSC family protein n=1 Tax=Streptomyces sp. I05A-00742 TaxID=2732853 RepID=UPI001488ACE1